MKKVLLFKDLTLNYFDKLIKFSTCFLLFFAYIGFFSFAAVNHIKRAYFVSFFLTHKCSSSLFRAYQFFYGFIHLSVGAVLVNS